MDQGEYSEVEKFSSASTCSSLSDYARRLLLKKPVNIKYRNVSIDDFLSDMLDLKRELNAIGNNFNQSVHKLHMLRHQQDILSWAIKNEKDKEEIFKKIEEIMSRLNEVYGLWLQR